MRLRRLRRDDLADRLAELQAVREAERVRRVLHERFGPSGIVGIREAPMHRHRRALVFDQDPRQRRGLGLETRDLPAQIRVILHLAP